MYFLLAILSALTFFRFELTSAQFKYRQEYGYGRVPISMNCGNGKTIPRLLSVMRHATLITFVVSGLWLARARIMSKKAPAPLQCAAFTVFVGGGSPGTIFQPQG